MTVSASIPKVYPGQDDFPSVINGADSPDSTDFLPYRSFRNFVIIPLNMISQPNIPASAVNLYGILSKYAGKDGFCYPSQKTLACDLGVTERQVRNLIHILEENNYIRRIFNEEDHRIYYIFSVNPVIAEDLKHPDFQTRKAEDSCHGASCENAAPVSSASRHPYVETPAQVFPPAPQTVSALAIKTVSKPSSDSADLTVLLDFDRIAELPWNGHVEIDFRFGRNAISAPSFIIKENRKAPLTGPAEF
ncbi:MAG: helix-turn-helix domain-containing protein, partial [Deltaproteobacteria bacterium]|nr:helix-turn-helix domain-containing protein [Deltaproteobacteria bacterium]